MVVTILLILLVVLLAVFAIILLAPIAVSCSGAIKESSVSGEILGWWLHPNVLRLVFDPKKKVVFVFGCGRFRIFSSESRESQKEKEPAVPQEDSSGDQKKEPRPVPQPQEQQERASVSSRELPHRTPEEPPKAVKHEETPKDKKQGDAKDSAEIGKPSFSEKLVPLKKAMVFLKDPSFRAKIFWWLKRAIAAVFRAVSMRIVAVRVKAGLFDPSLTGAAYGYFTGLQYMVSTEKSFLREIQFEPVFNDEPFSAEGRVELSSSIVRLCLPVVFAVLTFPYLHAYILYRRAKKIGKK
jgi:hypothetical protein